MFEFITLVAAVAVIAGLVYLNRESMWGSFNVEEKALADYLKKQEDKAKSAVKSEVDKVLK